MQIEIFTGPSCGHCARAKALLDERGLTYIERDVSDPDVRRELAERLPREKAIPQIIIDGEHIGGYEDLEIRFGIQSD